MRCAPLRKSSQGQHQSKGRHEMLTKLIKAALIVALLAMVVESLPDIRRYLELREM